MPDPRDLRRLDSSGETVIFAGSRELFRYAEGDTAMRNVAVAVLRQLKFGGQDVATVMGLTPNYVSTLHQRALREGTAGLVRPGGRPWETGEESWERARQWRAAGVRDAEIARRLGVNQSTVLRRLGRAHVQDPLPEQEAEQGGQPEDAAPEPRAAAAAEPRPVPGAGEPQAAEPEAAAPQDAGRHGPGPAGRATARSRYAGAMLLHAFGARAGAQGS
jgi:hypothetical protein